MKQVTGSHCPIWQESNPTALIQQLQSFLKPSLEHLQMPPLDAYQAPRHEGEGRACGSAAQSLRGAEASAAKGSLGAVEQGETSAGGREAGTAGPREEAYGGLAPEWAAPNAPEGAGL